ncbi:CD1375 family protein [Brevibacillus sp. FSL L8-0710]
MATIYYRLIKQGVKSFDQVPDMLKEEVQALLDADNA